MIFYKDISILSKGRGLLMKISKSFVILNFEKFMMINCKEIIIVYKNKF